MRLSLTAVALSLCLAGAAPAAIAQTPAETAARLDSLDRALALRGTGTCDTRMDTLADQVMLLHTQLMMTSLACEQVYGDPSLYERYVEFTITHEALLTRSKDELTRRFAGTADGLARFDRYRTDLANAESEYMREVSTGAYCAMRQSRFNSLIDSRPDQFEGYAEELAQRASISLASCLD